MFTSVYLHPYVDVTSLTKFSNSSFLQMVNLFREASEHGAKEHNLFVLPLHLILQLQDMFVCSPQKPLREETDERVCVYVLYMVYKWIGWGGGAEEGEEGEEEGRKCVCVPHLQSFKFTLFQVFCQLFPGALKHAASRSDTHNIT